MAETHTRQAKRQPVTLKIKFKSSTLDQFIERYSVDVSHGGIFIRTKDPLAVGTQLRFEFQLKDASPLIRGDGTVVWTREHDPSRAGVAPGMGVRFDRLAEGSQEVLDKILSQKTSKGAKAKGPNFNEAPTKVAPSPLLAGLNKESGPKLGNMAPKSDSFGSSGVEHTGTDATPLPTPMPFHSDADDFPEEAFEEATKVAALDALAAQSIREDPLDEEEPVFKEPPLTKEELEKGAKEESPDDELAARRAKKEAEEKAAAAKAAADKKAAEEKAAADKKAAEAKKAEAKKTEAKKAEAKKADGKKAGEKKKKAAAASAAAGTEKAEAATAKERPAAAAKEAPEQKSSGLGYVAAAAVVLLLGGGAYWYMTKDKGADETAASQPAAGPGDTAAQPAPAVEPPTAPAEPPEPPPVETFEAKLAVEPADATVEVIGGDQTGTELALAKGAEHMVRISAPGYIDKEIKVSEANAEQSIKLIKKPHVIRVTSEPEGAKVTLGGRAIKGVTPLDVPITKRLQKETLKVVVSKRGFRTARLQASGTEGFDEEADRMVHTVNATLDELVAARPTPKKVRPRVVKKDEPKKVEPKKDEPKKVEPKKDEPKKDEPKKDEPKKVEPKKDEPKKDEPKKDEPKKDEPKKDPPKDDLTKDPAGPTPDWLN